MYYGALMGGDRQSPPSMQAWAHMVPACAWIKMVFPYLETSRPLRAALLNADRRVDRSAVWVSSRAVLVPKGVWGID